MARWNPENDISDLPLGPGYQVINPDNNKDDWIPVNFDFDTLQWGLTYQRKTDSKFEIYQPAPPDYGLQIYGEERVWDWSQWGPLDGTTDPEEGISLWFGSDAENALEPEPEDVSIPTINQVEKLDSAIADLAVLLPSHFDKPRIPTNQQPTCLMGTMAQIAATTTLTSTIAWSSGPTVSSRTGAPAGGIWESLKKDIKGGSSHKRKKPNPDPGDGGDPGESGGGGYPGRSGDEVTLEEGEVLEPLEEGGIQEEIQEEEATDSSGRNPMFSMEIKPKSKGSSPNGRSIMARTDKLTPWGTPSKELSSFWDILSGIYQGSSCWQMGWQSNPRSLQIRPRKHQSECWLAWTHLGPHDQWLCPNLSRHHEQGASQCRTQHS